MRGKVAKKLRRLAREASKGELPDKNFLQNQKTGQVILGKCERNFNQKIKKAYKDGILTEAGSGTQEG